MFVDILHFHCLLVALSPAEWRDLHMLSSLVRRIIRYCEMHPPIPPMVNTSRSLSTIGFFGGVAACEAMRTTCRRSFWQIQRLYAWYSWMHDDLHDRVLHYHQYRDFVARLLRFSSRFVDVYALLSASPLNCNPHLVETLERTAQIIGYPPRASRAFLGGPPPPYMLHR